LTLEAQHGFCAVAQSIIVRGKKSASGVKFSEPGKRIVLGTGFATPHCA
jgi:hypothetical protein